MDVINVDEESREKEKDRYVKECRECLDNPWKVVFCYTLRKKRPDLRTIEELATVILGDKEVATGPLLEKSCQVSARKAHDEAEEPQSIRQQRRYGCMKMGTVGKSQNDGWLRCVRESGKLLRYLRKQVYGGGIRARFRVALQILRAFDHKACYDCREQAQSDRASAEVRMTWKERQDAHRSGCHLRLPSNFLCDLCQISLLVIDTCQWRTTLQASRCMYPLSERRQGWKSLQHLSYKPVFDNSTFYAFTHQGHCPSQKHI